MAKVLCKCGIKRESGYLYFVNKQGHAARVKMKRPGMKGGFKQEVLEKSGIKRESGMLYFIDKQGNIACVAMARGGRKKKAVKKKAVKKKRI